ncbi:cyclin-dependent kinase inhibitor 7 isoform X2 [Sesamum indicum]|uniref:Cyclin-dependent kinase inhibitor n=1 Tax=Sesamum indicum TaxID=4182 RepID=A0A6I9TPZ4_SESIN|nr:cyclin-dependent kinase inhibitor 7 isoform X2 [Sesamum indicum]
MGDYMKRCDKSVTMKSMEDDMRLISSKKRKFYSELENECCGNVEVEENSVSPAASRTSGCCKHDESTDVVKRSLRSPDLENVDDLLSEGSEMDIAAFTEDVFREATPTSELYGDSEQMLMHSKATSKRKSSTPPRRKIPASLAENMPSAAELEEFFAAAEKYEQKRFTEKYNYDIVKDVPLEGKYQWVRLQP